VNVPEVISARAHLKGIRWALLSAAALRILTDQPKAIPPGTSVGALHVREVRCKPGRKISAYYDVLVYTEGKGASCLRPVAVTWKSEIDADRGGERNDITKPVFERRDKRC